MDIKNEIKSCDRIADKEKRLACKFSLLYKVTEMQDRVNLDIIGDFRRTDPNCSKDKRWYPIHMIDNANAIILGISRNKGRSGSILREGYVEEKINALNSKWTRIKWMK